MNPDLQLTGLLRMIDSMDGYAIFMLDENGKIDTWTPAAEKITGYTAHEVKGKRFLIFFPENDQFMRRPDRLLHVALGRGKVTDQGWRLKKNGGEFWCNLLITPILNDEHYTAGFTVMMRDLTQLKESESRLKASESRYHKMIVEIKDYAIFFLDPQGNIQDWNKGAEFIKGYKANEIIGKNFELFYTPEDRAAGLSKQLINEAARNGRVHHEGWRVRKDGTRFWGSVTITALHNDDGDVIGFTKITHDLTEKVLAENATRQNLKELEIKNKELEQFVYIASHDLQEPLLTVSNFIELLQVEYADVLDDNAKMYFDFIGQANTRMRALIHGLLDYSRIGRKSQVSLVDCNQLLDTLQNDLANLISTSGARLIYHDLPAVYAYETELRQLFQNLISNAVKFREKDVKPEINISAKKTANFWEFAVQDNGIGIDPKFREKIFLIFQRLHNRSDYEGNGIGLAHCKKIAELHEGEIWVESQPGNGSTFYFTINDNLQKKHDKI